MKPRTGPGLYALIFCVTLAAYFPAITAGYIWNDSDYVTAPALQSVHGLGRILFEVGATEQYYPVLHGAFWIEHRLWGDAAAGYHLLNILLHATSACLLVLVLRRLSGAPSSAAGPPLLRAESLAGLLFALHPVGVESVAWISEEKNTLSTVFYLLAALVYLKFIENRKTFSEFEQEGRPVFARVQRAKTGRAFCSNALVWYFLSLGLFIVAILSKTVAATLPGALLVVLWWKQGRLSWRRDVLPLVPWFAIGGAWGLFSAWVERTYVGAQGADFGLNALERCLLAGRAVWFYLGKLAWPANLIFIYPRWTVNGSAWSSYLWPLGVLALVAALWLIRKRTRGPLAALLFFLGSLFPVCGFFNLYGFVFSYVADHWQYLPSIGIFTLAAAGWERLAAGRPNPAVRRSALGVIACMVLAVLGGLTFRQSLMYKNMETFYNRTLVQNPACWMAHTNLGLILAGEGRAPEAIAHYEKALSLNPYHPDVIHNDLGGLLLDAGREAEAALQFEDALRLNPENGQAHLNLGNIFLRQRRLPEAIGQFGEAARVDPGNPVVRNNLGVALGQSGRTAEAIAQFQAALRLNPGYAQAQKNLRHAQALP